MSLNKKEVSQIEESAAEDLEAKRLKDLHELAQEKKIRRVGVLTSGGDAPGMNGLIRSVTRASTYYGLEVMGIRRGYHGLWKGDMSLLTARDVSDTLQRGGTFLMTARSETFTTEEGLKRAAAMADVFNLDAIFCLGGDGTWRGAQTLTDAGVCTMALPATIDNDIAASDYCIGYDTAMNTAIECVDKLRDTASSHERCSVVEVMGRHNGYLAMTVGIATGAEIILIPEHPADFMDDVVSKILSARNRGKRHYIVIDAEGVGDAAEIARHIEETTGIESRASTLGYVQRGGNPSLRDRYLASLMGVYAVEALLSGRKNRAIILRGGEICDIDIHEANASKKSISESIYKKAEILAF